MTGDRADINAGAPHDYDSAEPQCVAMKADGERCTNGTAYSDYVCGTHKNVENTDFAPDEDDREWYKCPECGWQPASWYGGGNPPHCGFCETELPPNAPEWGER